MKRNVLKRMDTEAAIASAITIVIVGWHLHWYTYYIFQWVVVVLLMVRFWRLPLQLLKLAYYSYRKMPAKIQTIKDYIHENIVNLSEWFEQE